MPVLQDLLQLLNPPVYYLQLLLVIFVVHDGILLAHVPVQKYLFLKIETGVQLLAFEGFLIEGQSIDIEV